MRFSSSLESMMQSIRDVGVRDERVLAAMQKIPRHLFVPPDTVEDSYDDRALPIDCGQTISQPLIVGLMTEWLRVKPGHRILEIGTGSGYQAAVLAEVGAEVYSIEYHGKLHRQARKVLNALGYGDKTHLRHGDGHAGWPEEAPFDGLIITCQVAGISSTLAGQVRDGGRILAPVGGRLEQTLYAAKKHGEKLSVEHTLAVRFVPMLGEE